MILLAYARASFGRTYAEHTGGEDFYLWVRKFSFGYETGPGMRERAYAKAFGK